MVTPISMEPAHLSTILSMRTWKTSPVRSGRLLSTTPWLKSSVALGEGGGGRVGGQLIKAPCPRPEMQPAQGGGARGNQLWGGGGRV